MGILAAIASLVTWLGSGVAALIASRVLMFIALKVLLTGLFAVLLPLVINNFLQGFAADAFSALNNVAISESYSGLMTFTGFTAWLADCFQLQACFSLLISAYSFHLFLKMMPFSPVK